jgi:hypothetical protein
MLPKLFWVVSSRRIFDLKRETFHVGMSLAWLGKLIKKKKERTETKSTISIYNIYINKHLSINAING